MLVLFETAAGYAIFQLKDEKKLNETDDIFKNFETAEKANKLLKLKSFSKFNDTTEALAAATASVEGKLGKPLKKLLRKVFASEAHEQLAVADSKLGNAIKDKLSLQCVSNTAIHELTRGIRQQMNSLLGDVTQKELSAMSLGLAHSLSRYKLKFSPDKVDTMIVQAISLLDDLDKELNNYVMRCREWYGWHFPELGKIVTDNLAYAKVVRQIGDRTNAAKLDLSSILPEEIQQEVKEAAEISMGTEVSELDITNISYLCEQIIEITDYRAQLYDYLKNRMMAIAPNLTILVGELVGARLIAHAGSLLNLAKQPSSTVQILGAEKALFRALKTKHDTPKYGLIYHASLVGHTAAKNKGKVSRMLAAKASLAIRVDALGEETNTDLGMEHRAALELRMKTLEDGVARKISGTGKARAKLEKYENKSEVRIYNEGADSTIPSVPKKKRKLIEVVEDEDAGDAKKIKVESENGLEDEEEGKKKKKKKKRQSEAGGDADLEIKTEPSSQEDEEEGKKKKKKKKRQSEAGGDADVEIKTEPSSQEELEASSAKKKKKKKESVATEEVDVDTSMADTTIDTTIEGASEKKKKKKKKKIKEESD